MHLKISETEWQISCRSLVLASEGAFKATEEPPHDCITRCTAGRATLLRPVANVGAKFAVRNVLQMNRIREPLAELHSRTGNIAPSACHLEWRRSRTATSFVTNAFVGFLKSQTPRMIRCVGTATPSSCRFSRRAVVATPGQCCNREAEGTK